MSLAANAEWRKSSFSNNQGGDCVEVAAAHGQILVRDSKDPEGARLAFTGNEWNAFVTGVRAGEFDLTS